jgi:hypothetical protein
MMRMLDKPDVSVRLTAATIAPSYKKLIYHNMFKAQGTKNDRWYFLSKDLFPDYGFQFFFHWKPWNEGTESQWLIIHYSQIGDE